VPVESATALAKEACAAQFRNRIRLILACVILVALLIVAVFIRPNRHATDYAVEGRPTILFRRERLLDVVRFNFVAGTGLLFLQRHSRRVPCSIIRKHFLIPNRIHCDTIRRLSSIDHDAFLGGGREKSQVYIEVASRRSVLQYLSWINEYSRSSVMRRLQIYIVIFSPPPLERRRVNEAMRRR